MKPLISRRYCGPTSGGLRQHFSPRLKHETTAIEEVPRTSELSHLICEILQVSLVVDRGVPTSELPGPAAPLNEKSLNVSHTSEIVLTAYSV